MNMTGPVCNYLMNRIVPLIKNNASNDRIPASTYWTTNAVESVNAVLKHLTEWKKHGILSLADKLREYVRSKFREAELALTGRGQYMVADDFDRHRISYYDWCQLPASEKVLLLNFSINKCFIYLHSVMNIFYF